MVETVYPREEAECRAKTGSGGEKCNRGDWEVADGRAVGSAGSTGVETMIRVSNCELVGRAMEGGGKRLKGRDLADRRREAHSFTGFERRFSGKKAGLGRFFP